MLLIKLSKLSPVIIIAETSLEDIKLILTFSIVMFLAKFKLNAVFPTKSKFKFLIVELLDFELKFKVASITEVL